jgi:hypothetical protein
MIYNDSDERSTFRRALDQYVDTLPEKRQKGKFFVACTSGGDAITAESIHLLINRAEEKKSSKSVVGKILTPVVNVLKDYDCVINSLCQSWNVDIVL